MAAYLTERVKLIGCLPPKDCTGSAQTPYFVKLSNYERVCFVLYVGALSSSDTMTVTLNKATDSSGTGITAIAGKYRASSTGAAGGTLEDGALTALTDSGITIANTKSYYVYTFEAKVPADTGTDYPYVGLYITSPGAHATLLTVIALGYEARWQQDVPPSPIV